MTADHEEGRESRHMGGLFCHLLSHFHVLYKLTENKNMEKASRKLYIEGEKKKCFCEEESLVALYSRKLTVSDRVKKEKFLDRTSYLRVLYLWEFTLLLL